MPIKLISDDEIDSFVEHFEKFPDKLLEQTIKFMEDHPVLLAFMEQENFKILTNEEKNLQWYITVICMVSIENSGLYTLHFDQNLLEQLEENNWIILEKSRENNPNDPLAPFFENYQQVDLLAFVEDAIQPDDASPVTSVGKEILFISIKTLLDNIINNID